MCAGTIYGENFNEYTADYNAAISRRDSLTRRRELESWIVPFMDWLDKANKSEAFRFYEDVRQQLRQKMPWIWSNGEIALRDALATTRFKEFFDDQTDPKREFAEIIYLTSAHFTPLM
jgi:hypothetical protein